MARRRNVSLVGSMVELSLLSPFVAAARLARMGNDAARGRARAADWPLLASEKVFAAQQAWAEAAGAMFQLQQQALASSLAALGSPWPNVSGLAWWQRRQADVEHVAAAAAAPVARRVKRNARRPGR
jgi:hypothetical protein